MALVGNGGDLRRSCTRGQVYVNGLMTSDPGRYQNGGADAPPDYLVPTVMLRTESDTDGDTAAYSALQPRPEPDSAWTMAGGRRFGGPSQVKLLPRHSHRLLWVFHVLIGAVAVAALILALLKDGSHQQAGDGCPCAVETSADLTAEVAALRANVTRLHALLTANVPAEPASAAPPYFTLEANVSGAAVLRLTPPAHVQASGGLIIDGPVTAAGVALAPLADSVAILTSTLGARVGTLERRLHSQTQCRLVSDVTTIAQVWG